MDAFEEPTFDFRDILWKARHYRWLIALPIIAALCIAVIYYRTVTPIYESYVVLSATDRTPLSPSLEALTRPERDPYSSARDRAAKLENRIHARAFLTTLVERLGAARDMATLNEARGAVKQWPGVTAEEYASRIATTRLGRKIDVTPSTGDLVRISIRDLNPARARTIASAVADLLLEQSRRSSMERAQARGAFSADQIGIYQERLRSSEEALRTFQESLIGRNISSSAVTDDNLEIARSLIRLNGEEIDQVLARIGTDRAIWDQSTGGGSMPDLTSTKARGIESRLGTLEISYAQAVLGGQKTLADVSSLKSSIADARQSLYSEYENLAAGLPDTLSEGARAAAAGIALDRSVLRSLREKGSRLTAEIDAFSRVVRNSPRDQMEMERLKSAVETNRQLLATLQKEATSSQMTEALETSELGISLDIVEPAQIPLTPVSPNKLRIFAAALLLGPLTALGLILGIEKLGAVIRTVEQAEHEIGAPVIGTVPRVEGWSRPGSFLQNNWAPLSIVLLLLLTGLFYTIYNARRTGPPQTPGTTAVHP